MTHIRLWKRKKARFDLDRDRELEMKIHEAHVMELLKFYSHTRTLAPALGLQEQGVSLLMSFPVGFGGFSEWVSVNLLWVGQDGGDVMWGGTQWSWDSWDGEESVLVSSSSVWFIFTSFSSSFTMTGNWDETLMPSSNPNWWHWRLTLVSVGGASEGVAKLTSMGLWLLM